MDVGDTFVKLALSMALGLLVGMQRERAQSQVAGVRTFALITVLGTLTAILSQWLGGWIVVAGLLGVGIITALANVIQARLQESGPGTTTEIAAMLMFAVGAYLVFGAPQVAVVVAGAAAVLLYVKPVLHGLVRRIGDQDMRAMMQFVLIALVILPVMPNRPYGPFEVLNPREIWWFVVLVVGISLGGYVALKALGQRAGAVVGGLLGGVISSTATTMSYARRASNRPAYVAASTLVIMLAATVVYARVLAEVSLVAPGSLRMVGPPIVIMLIASTALSIVVWWSNRKVQTELPPQENPTELKAAILFAVLYAIVSFAAAAAKHYFSDAGIYAVAGISGLTDMDAITLSTARMVVNDGVNSTTAWRAILIAAMANLAFKAGIVALVAGRTLFLRIALLFGLNIAVGIALMLLWPDAGVFGSQ